MKRRKTLALFGLWYIDPSFHLEDDGIEPCPIFISGFPVKLTDTDVTLATEAHADGEHRQFTTVPKVIIKEMRQLKRIPIPDWVAEWRERFDKH